MVAIVSRRLAASKDAKIMFVKHSGWLHIAFLPTCSSDFCLPSASDGLLNITSIPPWHMSQSSIFSLYTSMSA